MKSSIDSTLDSAFDSTLDSAINEGPEMTLYTNQLVCGGSHKSIEKMDKFLNKMY